MKYLFLILFLFPGLAIAQSRLSGQVTDAKSMPIPFVNVFLRADSSKQIVAFGQSSEKGFYTLNTNLTGKFLLNFSALSYQTKVLGVELSNQSKEIPNNVAIVFEPIGLSEVIVAADKSVIVKRDTIIFDAKSFMKGTERTVEDLLKNIPGLSIDDDGGIKVGNQEIEKIMVDGDDFFEKGYRLLSRNMPAYPIEKVEVYQHYSNNKLLKGVEYSNKVALNLKLNEKAKRRWFGNINSGMDPVEGSRYELLGNLMNFGTKNKFYGITSLNNTGGDVTGDVKYLIRSSESDEPGSLGESQAAGNILNISSFVPNLKRDRFQFNNSAIYSLNGIFNLNPTLKLKVLALLNPDEWRTYKSSRESVTAGTISFTNKEDHQLRKVMLTGSGRIDLTKDISKSQTLVFTSKYNQASGNDHNYLIYNDSVSNEILKSANLLLDQKLVYTNRIKKNRVLLVSGRYIYEQAPQHYSLDKFYYHDLFPAIESADGVLQSSEDQMHFAGLEAHWMDRRPKGNLLELTFGNQLRSDLLTSELLLPLNNLTNEVPSGYRNNLTYTTNDLYLLAKIGIRLKKFRLFSGLDFHQLYNQLKNQSGTSQQQPFFVNPLAGIEWKMDEKNQLMTSYGYNHSNASATNLYDQYICTGFRSFSRGTGKFNQLDQSTFLLTYSHGGFGDRLFANTFIMYTKNYDFYSTNTVIAQNFAKSEQILIKNREFLTISTGIDKYIKSLSATFKVKLGATKYSYANRINGSDLNNINSNCYTAGLELRSGFKGAFNYHVGSKWTYNEIKASSMNKYTDNVSFLDLTFVAREKWDIQLQTERYFFGSLGKKYNTYYFLDLKIRYNIFKNKLLVEVSGQNLLNTKTFRNYSISDISVSETTFRLQPRFLLLKAEFRF